MLVSDGRADVGWETQVASCVSLAFHRQHGDGILNRASLPAALARRLFTNSRYASTKHTSDTSQAT